MKKIYSFAIAALCCFFTLNLNAQNGALPNPGFEKWSQVDPSIPLAMPDGWITTDLIFTLFFEANTKTVVKTTDKKSGTAAVLLKRDTATLFLFGIPLKDTLEAGLILGDLLTGQSGMPLKTRPAGLSGFYKYKNPDKDTSNVSISAIKYNATTKEATEIGKGVLVFTPTTAYTAFSVPMKYKTGTTGMDTLNVVFNCGSDLKSTKTELIIDDLGLTWAVGTDDFEAVPVSIYPNPAFEFAYFDFKAVPQAATIELFDMNGRTVRLENINNSLFQLSLNDFATGTYVYKVSNTANQTIKTGKIEVLK
jgi:hypothetical protein